MTQAAARQTGSKGDTSPKTKPDAKEQTTIRRIEGVSAWIVPKADLEHNDAKTFTHGLMFDVTFDPDAKVMRDLWCGTGNVSQSTMTGVLQKFEFNMPADAKKTGLVRYDKEQKVFHVVGEPSNTFTTADYLLLHSDGTATAGWKN